MASPNIPDYMLNPDAVMKDVNAAWRFKTPPDYSKTRAVYKDGTFIARIWYWIEQSRPDTFQERQ